jgi:hypothetical protein
MQLRRIWRAKQKEDLFDDNRNNFRGNQYPCRDKGINKINNINNFI